MQFHSDLLFNLPQMAWNGTFYSLSVCCNMSASLLVGSANLLAQTISWIVNCCFEKETDVLYFTPQSLKHHQIHEETMSPSLHSQRVILVANKTIFMKHYTGKEHPERPERVEAIENALIKSNLMDHLNQVFPRQATLEEVALCHDFNYLDELNKQINSLKLKQIECDSFDSAICRTEHVPSDFQISSDTLQVSLYAAGAPLTAIEYILNPDNQTNRAFCIVRPPGHHAHYKTGSGFCVFNNVAIAAKHLTQNFGFKRVLIVDWDAHHGDGTQELTEDDPSIFYFSTHRDTSAGKGFYPGPYWGNQDQRGKGKGIGTVLNCPVYGSKEECRQQILNAFKDQLVPAIDKYQPDFVLISCGFDAHEKDTLVGLGLKDEDYRDMTSTCVKIADKYAKGRIISVLEGGYNLNAISNAAVVHVQALEDS